MNRKKMVWAVSSAAFHASRNAVLSRAPSVGRALSRLGELGRGLEGSSAAEYFGAIASDYEQIARFSGVGREDASIFHGRSVLELGLGSTRAVALHARIRGALRYEGCDATDGRTRDSRRLASVYEAILAREGVGGGMVRAEEYLRDIPVHRALRDLEPSGKRFDLVISRGALEHTADLEEFFASAREVTTDDAVMIHKVDLRCHGARWDHELDFLSFPENVYQSMASHSGLPNRARVSEYLSLGARHGFAPVWAGATNRIAEQEVERVRNELSERFRLMSASTLAVLGFWMVMVGPRHPLATGSGESINLDQLPIAPAELLSRY